MKHNATTYRLFRDHQKHQSLKSAILSVFVLSAIFCFSTVNAANIYNQPQLFDGEFYDQVSTEPSLPVNDETGSYYLSVELVIDDVEDYRPIVIQGGTNSHNIEIYLKPESGRSPDLYINHNRGNGGNFDSVAYPFVRKNGKTLIGKKVLLEVIYSSSTESGTPDLIVKFDKIIQEPFPVVARNGFNDVYSFRRPANNSGNWVIGKIDHNQFGIRSFVGSMHNLRLGVDEESSAELDASSTRAPVINSPLQSVLDNNPDPETYIPVSVLLKKPEDLPQGVEGWPEIERLQQEFSTALTGLPDYNPILQPVYSLTTSPIVFVDLTPAQIETVSGVLQVSSLTDLPDVTEDTVEAYDIIYTPDEISPPINGTTVGDSGLTGDGVLIAVVDGYLDSNSAYDDNIVATINVATEVRQSVASSNVASCIPPAASDLPAHGSRVVSFAVGEGGVAPDADVVYYNRSYCVGTNKAGGGFEAILASFDKILVELELASEGLGGIYAPDIVLTAQSVTATDNVEFHNYAESCDSYLDEAYPDRVDALKSIVLDHGVPIFSSSGNEGSKSGTNFPSCLSFVTGVGMSADSSGSSSAVIDEVFVASNTAAHLKLAAPGAWLNQRDIWFYFNDENQKLIHTFIGTSYSTPIAAGVAALVLEKARDCQLAGCGTVPIDSIESIGVESLLPGILTGTGKLIPDPNAIDPVTQAVLLIPRVNALRALDQGLDVPVIYPALGDANWFVDGYGGGELRLSLGLNGVLFGIDDLSEARIEWTVDGESQGSALYGDGSTTYSNCTLESDDKRGNIISRQCDAVASTLAASIKTSNDYGVSRTISQEFDLALEYPPIAFRTEPQFKSNLKFTGAGVFLEQLPADLNQDSCKLQMYVNGLYYSTVTTERRLVPPELLECLPSALTPLSEYDTKDLPYVKSSTYSVQLCRMNASLGDNASCSATHLLPY